jgi:hypothetical protein
MSMNDYNVTTDNDDEQVKHFYENKYQQLYLNTKPSNTYTYNTKPHIKLTTTNNNNNPIIFNSTITNPTTIRSKRNPTDEHLTTITTTHTSSLSKQSHNPLSPRPSPHITSIYRNNTNITLYQSLFTQRNKSLSSQTKPKTVYERSQEYVQSTRNKIKAFQSKLTKIENEQCSFSPKISSNTRHIITRGNSYRSYTHSTNNQNDFYLNNIQWKEQTQKQLHERMGNVIRKQYEECSFQPKINRQSSYEELVNKMKKNGKRNVYDKQLMWKKRIDWEKEEIRNEIEMKRKDEIKRRISERKSKRIKTERDNMNHQEVINDLALPKKWNCNYKRRDSNNCNCTKVNCNINDIGGMLTPRESITMNNKTLMNDINNMRQSFNDLKRSLEQNKLLLKE